MTIDTLPLQELREAIRSIAEQGDVEARLIMALIDERAERVGATAEPAPEPEGLREAATRAMIAMDHNVRRHETMWVSEQRELAARLRNALSRPATAEGAESRLASLQNLPNEVPTSWLDPLLTGPEAVLPSDLAACTPRHIEALLRGIQDRQRAVVRAVLASDDGEQAHRPDAGEEGG
ncbi:MAG: hypothetical protein V2J24_23760 [Pseudomonadales bacterium]|jgi:hypothetical protein|nr:hypothetical protein [Pseudomonadales bacterium]